jgi:hypothetical protein
MKSISLIAGLFVVAGTFVCAQAWAIRIVNNLGKAVSVRVYHNPNLIGGDKTVRVECLDYAGKVTNSECDLKEESVIVMSEESKEIPIGLLLLRRIDVFLNTKTEQDDEAGEYAFSDTPDAVRGFDGSGTPVGVGLNREFTLTWARSKDTSGKFIKKVTIQETGIWA